MTLIIKTFQFLYKAKKLKKLNPNNHDYHIIYIYFLKALFKFIYNPVSYIINLFIFLNNNINNLLVILNIDNFQLF